MNIALFDLDHTLLPIDSDFTWSVFTNAIGWTDAAETARQNERFYQQYVAGTLDMNEYVRFVTRALRTHGVAAALAAQARYLQEYIQPQIRPAALQLLAQHRAAGDTLVLTSATNQFIATPIGVLLGFEAANVLTTGLEQDESGHYTGNIRGVPNLREGKVHNLEQWLAARGLGWGDVHITFYTDSYNDLPLLERATTPVATNSDARLRALAQQRGWRVLDLFPTS